MTGLRQNPFPHDGLRFCTFPGHQGENPLPATEEYFPVRKSGPNAGSFVGWCRACQTLSARRYKAEPERQGVRGGGGRSAAPQRSYEQFRDHHAEVEPIRSTQIARGTPSEGPCGPDEGTWPSASPERQVLPSGSVRGREQSLLEHQSGTDGSVESWAASWYERLGARPESARYLEAITAWRNAWRPKRVRVLLVAESHVGEHPGDDRISVLPMRWINRPLPNRYVRLIYCLGYGATEICSAVPQSNAGTPQFWNIFGQIALGQSPPTKSSTSLNERLRWKVRVLEELERRELASGRLSTGRLPGTRGASRPSTLHPGSSRRLQPVRVADGRRG